MTYKDVSLKHRMGCDDVLCRDNYFMIAKWRPSWIRVLAFLDFPKTLGKRRNLAKSNQN